MTSIPNFYSDYQFSPEEFSRITSVIAQENYGGAISSTNISNGMISSGATISNSAMLSLRDVNNNNNNDNNFPIWFDNCGIEVFSSESNNMSPVGPLPSTFAEGLGISDMAMPTLLDEYSMGWSGNAGIQNFGDPFRLPDVCEFGEDCCDFVPNYKPPSVCPSSGENWGIQCNQIPSIDDHTHMKVGRYTMEERKDRILRYLKKRNQRNFNKTIKYACRKTLADRRVRIRGRFARNNNELGEDQDQCEVLKKNDNDLDHQEKVSYCSEDLRMKNDEDEWLQEAMASLMYLPYIAG